MRIYLGTHFIGEFISVLRATRDTVDNMTDTLFNVLLNFSCVPLAIFFIFEDVLLATTGCDWRSVGRGWPKILFVPE